MFFCLVFCGCLAASVVVPRLQAAPQAPALPETTRPRPRPYYLPAEYREAVIHYCDETGVPVWLASRMFGQESVGDPLARWWDPWAVSKAGALGIAQIMPFNFELFAVLYNDGRPIDPFNPEVAIRVGTRHLAALHADLGSWRAAVGAYNCGIGRWRRGPPLPGETVRHIKEVMDE